MIHLWLIADCRRGLEVQRLVSLCLVSFFFLNAQAAAEDSSSREIDYRCDRVRFERKNNRAICSGNVVLRRSDILICCDELLGDLDAKAGEAKSMLCQGQVRVQRDGEYLWAQEADFHTQKNLLVLRGAPIIQRGRNLLSGRIARVYIDKDEAVVEKPTGRVQTSNADVPSLPPFSRFSPLPGTCSIPLGPKMR